MRDVPIEAQEQRGKVGRDHDHDIEDDGGSRVQDLGGAPSPAGIGIVGGGWAGSHQRAPLPVATTTSVRQRIEMSVTTEWWSTYSRSYLTISS